MPFIDLVNWLAFSSFSLTLTALCESPCGSVTLHNTWVWIMLINEIDCRLQIQKVMSGQDIPPSVWSSALETHITRAVEFEVLVG